MNVLRSLFPYREVHFYAPAERLWKKMLCLSGVGERSRDSDAWGGRDPAHRGGMTCSLAGPRGVSVINSSVIISSSTRGCRCCVA